VRGREEEVGKARGKERRGEGVHNLSKTTPPSSDGWLRACVEVAVSAALSIDNNHADLRNSVYSAAVTD